MGIAGDLIATTAVGKMSGSDSIYECTGGGIPQISFGDLGFQGCAAGLVDPGQGCESYGMQFLI